MLRFFKRLSIREVMIAATTILFACVFAVGVAIYQFRQDAIDGAVLQVRRLAMVLSGQLEFMIHSVDGIIFDVLREVSRTQPMDRLELISFVRSSHFEDLLHQRLVRLPHVIGVSIYDENGKSIITMPAVDATIDITDRDYFHILKDASSMEASSGLYISTPLISRVHGVRSIVFARRINYADGRFAGVFVVPIPLNAFARIYAPIEITGDLRLTLLRADGKLLLRYPDLAAKPVAQMPPESPWYTIVAHGGGEFRSPGYFDDVPRWFAIRPLGTFPLVLNVGMSETAALANWYHRSIYIATGTATLMILAAFLLWAARGQFQRLGRSEATLREKSVALAISNMRFDSALNNISQGLCMFDANQRVLVSNARYAEIYHLPIGAVQPGMSLSEILEIRLRAGTVSNSQSEYAADIGTAPSEVQILPDGRAIHICRNRMADGGWTTTHEDVTERYRNETQIAFMARHDLLTGLFNRASFSERIESAGARLRRSGETFTVLLLDLDRFKHVNDTLGHPAGDKLLRQTAERLKATLRETDVLARFGGDEFAIIQSVNGNQRQSAAKFAERVIEALSRPYDLDGQAVTIGTSIGIALAPDHGIDPDELIRNADLALYRAKADGRNGYSFFDSGLMEIANARQRLEADLRDAITNNEFELHYQPIVEIRTRKIVGAEALIRWRHPRLGLIAPMQFIPLAEETGLIERIGEWVLRHACVEATSWPEPVWVAVNLSPAQFRKGELLESVKRALAESGLPPRRLELEITESVFLAGAEENISLVKKMKALGVSIALDDFGTGYSSLSYLTTFPFDKVKIDKSFITNMTKRSDCAAVIASVMTLTRCLDVTTTAEGLETRQQLELLRAAGVDYGQGFLFGHPVPANELDFNRPVVPLYAAA